MANGGEPGVKGREVVPARLRNLWNAHPLVVVASVAVVALAVSVALIWPVTDLIAAHDVGLITGIKRAVALQAAREAVRTQLLTLGAGVFAAGALFYTARNFSLSRGTLEETRRTVELSQGALEETRRTVDLTEQGQVTERYTKAIDQLGSVDLHVRVGGIYALERIVGDSARDRTTIISVLITFIREHARERPEPPGADSREVRESLVPGLVPQVPESYRLAADIQAALDVVARADIKGDRTGILLPESRLFGTDFSGMNLRGATFIRADLAYSVFRGTHAEYTSFAYANLAYSVFLDAHLQNAWLVGAILTNAEFLAGTDLTGADLTDANLLDADLNDADLTGAKYPAGALPSGWERNGAGLLERAGTSPPDSR